jgi:hypothetical protein
MLKVDTNFDFVLYKHGPFSFELRDELTAMRADDFLSLEIKTPSYGPSLAAGRNAAHLKQMFPNTLKRWKPRVDFVARRFSDKGVMELERLATAFYVTNASRLVSEECRARKVATLKPHIPAKEALSAVVMVDRWTREAKNRFKDKPAKA